MSVFFHTHEVLLYFTLFSNSSLHPRVSLYFSGSKSLSRIFSNHGGYKLNSIFPHINLSGCDSGLRLATDSAVPLISSFIKGLLST